MPPLYLKESDIPPLSSIEEVRRVIDALEAVFLDQSRGSAFSNPRQRLLMPGATLHMMAAAIPGYFGYKAYTTSAGKARFHIHLFDAVTTDLLAVMEADTLGQIRTGAATGLATRLLSNPDSTEATLFGAGWQAQSQLLAMSAVREFKRIWIVNRDPERCAAFIRKMQPLVPARLMAANQAGDAVASSHVVTTMTSSREPVLKGEWLRPGQHINAAGGNLLLRRELDDAAVLRADRVFVDSIDQARIEAGEFTGVIESGKRRWQDFIELQHAVSGARKRESPTDITLFKSLGIAMEDMAIAKLVYEETLKS